MNILAVFIDFEKAFNMVWRKGPLIKLKKFGINGRMFDWIADFTTDRTFQVRVGDALSAIYTLENGKNQGSMISPELFISIIDDLPNSLQRVDMVIRQWQLTLQRRSKHQTAPETDSSATRLTRPPAACDKWGFRISTDKTVAVLFSANYVILSNPLVNLKVSNQKLKLYYHTKGLLIPYIAVSNGNYKRKLIYTI